ncbi:SET domain-containing protein [Prosthecobacter fluviatilis]|uniref:SET domain-containing protein n=1 Tax=Prosthecobacter fluviatilis TaxID=445931 RepID=A0ABW0KL99_9BACT
MPQAPTKRYWTVRSSSIHNRGIFARCDIPNDSPIIEYVGEKITKAESARRGEALVERSKKTGGAAVYVFTLNQKYDIDGAKGNNPARYINHSCDPNCEAFIIRGRIWIYSLRDIKAGEELTYNYGFDVDTWDEHPCRCGTDRCVGFIVEEKQWPKLLRKLEKLERDSKSGKLKLNGTDEGNGKSSAKAGKTKKPAASKKPAVAKKGAAKKAGKKKG